MVAGPVRDRGDVGGHGRGVRQADPPLEGARADGRWRSSGGVSGTPRESPARAGRAGVRLAGDTALARRRGGRDNGGRVTSRERCGVGSATERPTDAPLPPPPPPPPPPCRASACNTEYEGAAAGTVAAAADTVRPRTAVGAVRKRAGFTGAAARSSCADDAARPRGAAPSRAARGGVGGGSTSGGGGSGGGGEAATSLPLLLPAGDAVAAAAASGGE